VELKGLEKVREKIYHVYDARITRLEGAFYIIFAMDMDSGCQLGLARTEDFKGFRFLGITSTDDVRNGVLFPEKINGAYLRLERPNRARSRSIRARPTPRSAWPSRRSGSSSRPRPRATSPYRFDPVVRLC
jgi:predicted GH43/DUF377 family glycosyl hydrolase